MEHPSMRTRPTLWMRELNLQTEYANLKFAHLLHCSQALVAQLAEANSAHAGTVLAIESL